MTGTGRMRSRSALVMGMVVAALSLFTAAPANARGKILLVQSYHEGYAWTDAVTTGVRQALADSGIERMGFLLLGSPGETRDSVDQSLDFADSLDLNALRLSAGVRIYPDTELADVARQQGVISPQDDLLLPRFYLSRNLEGWLIERLHQWRSSRPHVIM